MKKFSQIYYYFIVNMKRISILLVILFSNIAAFSQTGSPFTSEEYERANTAVHVAYLSQNEKEVIRQLNLARMDPQRYCDYYVEQFVKYQNTIYSPKILPTNRYLKSLKVDAAKVKNLPLLYPDERLARSSSFHARDMGVTGRTGHDSSNGTPFEKRLLKYLGTDTLAYGENCSYGFEEASYIVSDLLIDNGIISLGHRHNILSLEFHSVGVGIFTHTVYRYNCVMDFSSDMHPRK